MLLMAVDIGNTNVVIGFIDDGRIAGTYRITTKANHTSDEYGLMITQFLALSGYKPADVDDVIISSVVPKGMHSFTSPPTRIPFRVRSAARSSPPAFVWAPRPLRPAAWAWKR